METEAIASSRAAETVAYAREIMRAMGILHAGPTEILTDNAANEAVGNNKGSTTRSRHFLRRYHSLLRRVAHGEAKLVYVTDAENPSDFLTKWAPARKLRASQDYAENASMQVNA